MDYFTCVVCGDHMGKGYDHTQCADFKKSLHEQRKKKKATKRLSKKQILGLENKIIKGDL